MKVKIFLDSAGPCRSVAEQSLLQAPLRPHKNRALALSLRDFVATGRQPVITQRLIAI